MVVSLSSSDVMLGDDLVQQMKNDVKFAFELKIQKGKGGKARNGFATLRGHGLFVYQTPDIIRSSIILAISLKFVTMEISNKKEHVLKLTHKEGNTYFLRLKSAEDVIDMQKLTKDAVIPSGAVEPKNSNDKRESSGIVNARKFSFFKKKNPENNKEVTTTKCFGVSLEEYYDAHPTVILPLVITKCIDELERRELWHSGLYRQNGFVGLRNTIKAEFDENEQEIDLSDETKWNDVYTIASVLKMYFRELPETIFTNELSDLFLSALDQTASEEEGMLRLKFLCQFCLPEKNKFILIYLFQHLSRVSRCKENQMEELQLSVVWGPSLFNNALQMNGTNQVVATILTHHEAVFYEDLPDHLVASLTSQIGEQYVKHRGYNENTEQEDESQININDEGVELPPPLPFNEPPML